MLQNKNKKEKDIRPGNLKEPFTAQEISKVVKFFEKQQKCRMRFHQSRKHQICSIMSPTYCKHIETVAETGKYSQELKLDF